MKKILVVDIEATCWEGQPPQGERSEIIEIGVAVLEAPDGRWEVADSFNVLIEPEESTVSDYCEELTGITQKALQDCDTTLEDAMYLLDVKEAIAWASWGNYDYNILHRECKRKGIRLTLPYAHLNIKALQSARYMRNPEPLQSALNFLEKGFNGKPHRAEDDALNAAEVLMHILNGGC